MLSKFSVKKPYTVVVFLVIIAILGVIAYTNMTVDLLPEMDLPYMVIAVVSPGASPEDVERSITSPVEQSMATIDNVKHISSTSSEHYSLIVMEYNIGVDMVAATLEVQTELDLLTGEFPEMTMQPIIMNIDPSMLPVMNIAISEKGKSINESSEYLESIGQQLLAVEGVAAVDYQGIIDNLILVMLDTELLKESIIDELAPSRDDFVNEEAYQEALDNADSESEPPVRDDYVDEEAYQEAMGMAVSMSDMVSSMVGSMLQPELIGQVLFAQNFNMPAGNVEIDGLSYLVKIGDQMKSIEDVEQMSIISIDFKAFVENYEDIISVLRQIYIEQSTLDYLQTVSDEEGIYKTSLDSIYNELENFEDSPFFEIKDPEAEDPVYVIDRSIVDGLASMGAMADDLEAIKIPESLMESLDLIDLFIEFSTDPEIIQQLEDLKESLIPIRESLMNSDGFFVKIEEQDPETEEIVVYYVINPSMIEMYRTFASLSENLEDVEVTQAQIVEMQAAVVGAKNLLDTISETSIIVEELVQNEQYFTKDYLQNEEGDYLNSEGEITENPEEFVLVGYKFNTAQMDALEQLPPMTFKVEEMANVVTLDNSGNQHTLINGSSGVMLNIQKQNDYSTVTVSKGIHKMLEDITQDNENFSYIVLSDQGQFINYMINTIIENLMFGALFAILILFIFLRKIKPTLIVGTSIFVSVVTALILMYFAGITLNIISMGGLALGVGMLVDNSIVVIENIYRKRAEGDSIIGACVDGAKQVSGAIIASTLTTVIMFLPIVFLEGLATQIFRDIAYTIAFSLGASLLVALTFVPMATSKAMGKNEQPKESKIFDKLKDYYTKSMEFFLNKRWIVIILVLVLFVSSIASVFFMNRIFFPSTDMGYVTLTARIDRTKLPQDISYEDATISIVEHLNNVIIEQDYVDDLGITVSSGMQMMGISLGSESISANVVLVEENKRTSANNIIKDLLAKTSIVPGLPKESYVISANADSMDMGMVDDRTLTFNIYGDMLDDTRKASRDVAHLLSEVEGVKAVEDGVGMPPLEYHLLIDPEKASPYGIYIGQALQIMQSLLAEPSAATTVRFDSTRLYYDVYVYGNDYDLTRWYITKDSSNNKVRVYIDDDENYHIEKLIEDEKVIIDVNRLYDNDKPLNEFTYSYEDKTYNLVGDSADGIVYYDVSRKNDIDLVLLELNSSVMTGTEYEYSVSVPMYKILKDESFATDEDGNIIYRIHKNDEGMPKFLQDEFGDPILDDQGNMIPDYVIDSEGNKIPEAIALKEGYLSITHENGIRRNNVTITLDDKANADRVLTRCRNAIQEYDPPVGVNINIQGESEIITDTYNTLIIMLLLGVVFIYLVMVAQFQSLKSPFIVMFTVPLAFTGSVFIMLITGKPISVVAMIGLILLMGIVVNNGIVFVDYVNKLIEDEGMERRKALIRAGKDRIRPIMMTSLTTICALLVMATDTSNEGAMMQPMALTTIGGMIYATFLTIYFVPIVYDIFNKKKGIINEEREIAGQVYTASLDFKPYTEIEKYKDEEPYDKALLKGIGKKMGKTKMLNLYNKKREDNEN